MATDSSNQSAAAGWARHNLEQLRRFQAFSLRAKLEAVQGMADVVRHLADVRWNAAPPSARKAQDL
jgi:Cu/Ag efflux pump CusA